MLRSLSVVLGMLSLGISTGQSPSPAGDQRQAQPAAVTKQPRGKLRDGEVAKQLDAYLNKLVEADRFSGSVVVARDGKPFFAKAYGLASKAYGVPNRVDTKFNLGSMNKMFTAVAICQLAQAGKLAFNDL